MNKVLDAAMAALRDLGLKVTTTPTGLITLRGFGTPRRYRAEVRPSLTRSVVGALTLALASSREERLLVTDHVAPPLAEELHRRGIQFADAAGNAFIHAPGLFVLVLGRRQRGSKRVPPRGMRIFRSSGLKILFALLCVRDLVTAPQREIARAAGVALGSVAVVLEGLRELGYVATIDGTRRLLHREKLIEQWTEGYARVLAPTLEMGRYAAPELKWWRRADPTPYGAQWGGETAAALLHRHLVPERAILYSLETPARFLLKYRLKADAEGPVILRRRFWHFESETPRQDIVPPLLVYADLVVDGDARSLDAAKAISDADLL
jgi:hypothetical protein